MKTLSILQNRTWLLILPVLMMIVSACSTYPAAVVTPDARAMEPQQGTAPVGQADVSFSLRTGLTDGKLAFIGQGGAIDGKINPELAVALGQTVQITLINGDGPQHDFTLPDLNVHTTHVLGNGSSTSVTFKADKTGAFTYFCSVAGHQLAGMQGQLVVREAGEAQSPQTSQAADVVRNPADLPAPVGDRPAQTVRFDLETREAEGVLADGTTYTYWTFDGQVPGPFLRVRVGDTVEIDLKNSLDSQMSHSIDLHAVTGPGGGAGVTGVMPGEEKSFTFQALNPGIYVYHCATPMVALHIANGMYGLILVEPEGGLPPVDHEYYVMQGEVYTSGGSSARGHQEASVEKLIDERPDYVLFNGAVGALTKEQPLKARVGETVRIFFGDGGPNLVSSFHMIGEIFDRVYDQGSLTSAPLTDVQTTLVPPGGATMVEVTLQVPGRYILVDHALSRLERGAAGYLLVEGPDNPDVFYSDHPADGSH